MGAVAQLWLLLWKCWKTTIRSLGWSIVQCLFTLVLWAILIYIATSDVGTFLKYGLPNSPNQDSPRNEIPREYDTSIEIEYKCEGLCNETQPDIRDAANSVCADSNICTMTENPAEWHNTWLKLYKLNDDPPKLDVDYELPEGYTTCVRFSRSSEQFDHGWFERCKATPVFQPLIAWIGHTDQFKVEWIRKTTDDLYSEITEARMGFWLVFYCIPLVLFCAQSTREVSEEASSNMKDYLLSMGMSRSMYYLHHFIYTYLKAWISIIGCSVIFGYIFEYKIGLLLFSIFSLSLLSWVGMSLMIGALIKKPGTSTFVFLIVSLALTFASTVNGVKRTNILLTLFLSLFPQFAVQMAMDSFREQDFRGVSIAFGDVGQAVQYGYILIIMSLSAVLCTGLAIFMDLILTTLENPMTMIRRAKLLNSDQEQIIADNHEEMKMTEPPAIEITDVHKMYSTGEYAVRGVHLNMFKGQVTALLGHNGAGKSTLFSMISGMAVPSRGSIKIMNISSIAEQQQLIGYCPQYNAIFPKLTVDEHLQFFSRLKGVDKWKGTGQKVLEILGMSDKGEAKAAELSGGMKRKLGIAIALAANSPIVLLDEPTAGMDTGARRDFEKLLLEWKKDHTILLTTHYTDEAELLADRIFIMAKGRVFCSGSTQFLRKRFLSGCILSFTAKADVNPESAAAAILERMKEFVPDTQIDRVRGHQFELGLNSDDKTSHTEMFRMIEKESEVVGIESYSLSLTKLEQVFLKVGEMTGTKSRQEEISSAIQQLIQENELRNGIPGKMSVQMLYLFMKRLHYDSAHLLSLIIRLLLLSAISFFVVGSIMEKINGSIESRTDLLRLPDCYRVGLHSSLHDKKDEFEHAANHLGYCITFDKFDTEARAWITSISSQRPPLLGALRKEAKRWMVTTFMRNEALLPALETVAAMANRPELKEVKYTMRTNNTKGLNSEDKAVFYPLIFISLFILCTPFMVMRPIGFHIVDATSHYAHQQRLTGIYRVTDLLAPLLYDFLVFNLHLLFFFLPLMISHMDILNTMTASALLIPFSSFVHAELLTLLIYRVFATRAMGESLVTILLLIWTIFTFVVIGLSIFLQKPAYLLIHPTASVVMMLNEDFIIKTIQNLFKGLLFPPLAHSAVIGYAIIHLLALLLPLLFIEFRIVERLRAHFARKREDSEKSIEAAPHSDDNDTILKVRNLHKRYGIFTKVPAVNGISFDVRAHECFGVLGVNGAGKTSTFEMLTGNASPSRGYATVGGVDCSAPATIGYCPQIDALIDDLSGFNALVVLAALHGYRNPRKVANILIDCVGMQAHAHKSSKQYSGGQRRKISVAAALLAQNSLIILDEPTAGIDPVARRDVWNVICALREATNTAVVLTSHSMDEVETLVSTLIIMARGHIAVMGTPQSVKNQFGAHYEMVLIAEEAVELIDERVQEVFPEADLLDTGSSLFIKFRIPRRSDDIFSSIYEQAESLAKELNVADFYLTQATLEDAFVLAANMPIDDNSTEDFVITK